MRLWQAAVLAALVGCEGPGTIGNPPDPSGAMSPEWGCVSVNGIQPLCASIFDPTHASAIPTLGSGNDRKMTWDPWAQRFLSVGLTYSGGAYLEELVGCSTTTSPLDYWQTYNYIPAGNPDQPSLGCAQNLCVVADRSSGQFLANTVTNLESGTGWNPWAFTVTGIEAIAAHSRDGDLSYNYVVSAGGSGFSSVNIQRLGPSLGLWNAHIPTPTYNDDPIRVGTLNMNQLYTTTQSPLDAYVGSGGAHLFVLVGVSHGADGCLRIMDFADVGAATFAPTLQGYADFCLAGSDVWEGALAQNIDGTLFLVAHCSGPNVPISMCYSYWQGPSRTLQMTFKQEGFGFGSLYRVGDYATAAPYWPDGGHHIAATTEIGVQGVTNQGQTWDDLIP